MGTGERLDAYLECLARGGESEAGAYARDYSSKGGRGRDPQFDSIVKLRLTLLSAFEQAWDRVHPGLCG